MFDFVLRIGDRRWNMLNDHVGETFEFAEEARADQAKQRTNVQFQFGFCQTNAEFIEHAGQRTVHIADDVRENLVQRLENKLNERTR